MYSCATLVFLFCAVSVASEFRLCSLLSSGCAPEDLSQPPHFWDSLKQDAILPDLALQVILEKPHRTALFRSNGSRMILAQVRKLKSLFQHHHIPGLSNQNVYGDKAARKCIAYLLIILLLRTAASACSLPPNTPSILLNSKRSRAPTPNTMPYRVRHMSHSKFQAGE